MKDPRLLLIRASAGTGKTHRLSARFLELLLAGVPPERILATTFTRKAAGEILDRVLERLVQAVEDGSELEKLAEDTGRAGLDRDQCLALLALLARNLHTFQVRTIDSFFVHLARLFALDLALPADWRIGDERSEERLRSEAWQDELAGRSTVELLPLLRQLLKGDAGRGVQASLTKATQELRPAFLESPPEAWDSLPVSGALADDDLRTLLEEVERAPLPLNADGNPDKRIRDARDTLLRRARNGEWEDLVAKNGLGVSFLAGKTSFGRKALTEELLETLGPLTRHAAAQVLAVLREQNLAAHALLEGFEAAFQACKREEGAYGFGDLPYLLAPRTAARLPIDERELDLWFRLDGRIDHLLLDEFQDTAPVQWRILAPIAEEIASTAEGRSFFCVGDEKQSIYSFRHAEPRLLRDMERLLPGLEVEPMVRSYRSSQVVLDAVNRVFEDVAENSALAGEELAPYRQAARTWTEDFQPHEAARSLPGAVVAYEAAESEKPEPAVVETTVERAAALRAAAPGASIGILLRRRKLIPELIHRLRKLGIDASGEGGTPLTDADSVLAFISLLHLADFPEDSAAAFHVASSPMGEYVELPMEAEAETRRRLSRELRRRLTEEGLGELTRELARRVQEDERWSAWDKARFAQLLEQAFAFESRGELRASAFVDHLRTKKVEASGGAAVRVMTIHGAKGLEFDAVILPELFVKFANLRAEVYTARPRPEELFERVCRSVKKGLTPLSPELRELVDDHTRRAVEDSLSVLYVAMTRAVRRLELVLPWENPKSKISVPATHHLLRAALASEGLHDPDEAGVIWEAAANAPGDGWAADLAAEPGSESDEEHEHEWRLAPSSRPRSLPRRRPSAEEGDGRSTAADALRPHRAATLGTLVHACLEELEWIEDFQLDDEVERLPAMRRAPAALRSEALELLRSALERPAIRAALSREDSGLPASCDPRVSTEERLVATLPDDEGREELWVGSIDRLVLAYEGDRVVHAEVLDYKTDHVETAELDSRVEFYAPQLRKYREVVAQRTGLDPASIRARLLFLATGEVREVD